MIETPKIASRYTALDVLRGVSSLAIVWFHCAQQSVAQLGAGTPNDPFRAFVEFLLLRLDIAVLVFFVISGICMCVSVEKKRGKIHPVRSFLSARAFRIFPPYWGSLLLWALFILVVPEVLSHNPEVSRSTMHEFSVHQWLTNIFLVDRIAIHFSGAQVPAIFPISWSLQYEIQFYALMATFLISRKLFWSALWILGAFTAYNVWNLSSSGVVSGYGFLWDGYLLFFILGIVCYYANNSPAKSLTWRIFLYLLAIVSLVLIFVIPSSQIALLTIASVITIIIDQILSRPATANTSKLETPALLLLGDISYSLYLIHLPITIFIPNLLVYLGVSTFWPLLIASLLLATPVSIAAAYLYYRGIERHFIKINSFGLWTENVTKYRAIS